MQLCVVNVAAMAVRMVMIMSMAHLRPRRVESFMLMYNKKGLTPYMSDRMHRNTGVSATEVSPYELMIRD